MLVLGYFWETRIVRLCILRNCRSA